jgi:hypothetical protein
LALELQPDDVLKIILATKGVLTPFQQKTGLFGQPQFPASMMRVDNCWRKRQRRFRMIVGKMET